MMTNICVDNALGSYPMEHTHYKKDKENIILLKWKDNSNRNYWT